MIFSFKFLNELCLIEFVVLMIILFANFKFNSIKNHSILILMFFLSIKLISSYQSFHVKGQFNLFQLHSFQIFSTIKQPLINLQVTYSNHFHSMTHQYILMNIYHLRSCSICCVLFLVITVFHWSKLFFSITFH